jgi:3'-phosphoadenosine 5'-phosphosulfate sulfotransferase (PAPS reductase)/FAD synthetase
MAKKKATKKQTIKKTHRETIQLSAKQKIGQPSVTLFKLAQLHAAKYNPRQIGSTALAGLTSSINRFGCVEPIIVNTRGKKNVIIGGHQRFKVLKRLKVKECICVTVDCNQDEEKLLNITLNNPHIQGEFIKEVTGYIEKLRKKMKDEDAFLDLRIQMLQNEISSSKKAEFEFRPGAANLKVKGGAKGFWLNKNELKKFKKYKNFVLDFSGGRDSTLALAWAVKHFKDRNIYPVYSDVGVEFPGMGAHVKAVCDFFKVEAVIRKPETEWWSWLLEKGWPSLIFRPCQGVFIFSVTAEFRKKFDPQETLLFDGSRGTQAVRGSKKSKTSELSTCPGYPAYHPCFDLTDPEAEQLLKQIKAPLWDGYDKGFVRTACWCCPGMNTMQAYALQKNYPGLADTIRQWEKKIGPIRTLEKKSFDDLVRSGEKKLKAGRLFRVGDKVKD